MVRDANSLLDRNRRGFTGRLVLSVSISSLVSVGAASRRPGALEGRLSSPVSALALSSFSWLWSGLPFAWALNLDVSPLVAGEAKEPFGSDRNAIPALYSGSRVVCVLVARLSYSRKLCAGMRC